jgi:hypothetical protein
MQNLAGANFHFFRHQFAAFPGESADADEPFRFENLQHAAQMFIANRKQTFALGLGEFVGREIRSAGRKESERTVIGGKMSGERFFRRTKTLREQFPETTSADFRARTIKTEDGAF